MQQLSQPGSRRTLHCEHTPPIFCCRLSSHPNAGNWEDSLQQLFSSAGVWQHAFSANPLEQQGFGELDPVQQVRQAVQQMAAASATAASATVQTAGVGAQVCISVNQLRQRPVRPVHMQGSCMFYFFSRLQANILLEQAAA